MDKKNLARNSHKKSKAQSNPKKIETLAPSQKRKSSDQPPVQAQKKQRNQPPTLTSVIQGAFKYMNCFRKNTNTSTTEQPTAVTTNQSEEQPISEIDDTINKMAVDYNALLFQHERIGFYGKDLDCLRPNRWLNDNVVDLGLSFLQKKAARPNVGVFNSQFYAKLCIIDSKPGEQDYFNGTAGWFKKGKFDKKLLWLIPICDNEHWYLIVVYRPTTNMPTICVLDSLRRKDYKSVKMIRNFLKQKFMAEHTGKYRKSVARFIDVPRQSNGSDCGLHLLRSAELFMRKDTGHIIGRIRRREKMTSQDAIFKKIKVPTRHELAKEILPLIKPNVD